MVRRYIREGSLKAIKLGKQWRIQRRDLDALTGKEVDFPRFDGHR
jgi:excisionase family DNA binding protein